MPRTRSLRCSMCGPGSKCHGGAERLWRGLWGRWACRGPVSSPPHAAGPTARCHWLKGRGSVTIVFLTVTAVICGSQRAAVDTLGQCPPGLPLLEGVRPAIVVSSPLQGPGTWLSAEHLCEWEARTPLLLARRPPCSPDPTAATTLGGLRTTQPMCRRLRPNLPPERKKASCEAKRPEFRDRQEQRTGASSSEAPPPPAHRAPSPWLPIICRALTQGSPSSSSGSSSSGSSSGW